MGTRNSNPQDMVIEIAFDSKDFKSHPGRCVYYKIEDAEGAIHDRNDFSGASREELLTARASLDAVTKCIEEEIDTRGDDYLDNVRKEINNLTQTGDNNAEKTDE